LRAHNGSGPLHNKCHAELGPHWRLKGQSL